ncbi:ATP-binding cassette sub-family A member 3 [Orchesella cincta]|uniref:ATP-binding cassette sub-family A member 3 n=1 Tax=Orchesella cincta TaxID=48709 RepID=A0A1D2MK71_ORCCI|nr:ATP-binding cassette sub-family A member 3 [Orchesella cincta]
MSADVEETYKKGPRRLSIFSPNINLVHPAPENNENTQSIHEDGSQSHEKIVHSAIPDTYMDTSSSNASVGSLGSRAIARSAERLEQVENPTATKSSKCSAMLHFWQRFSIICFSPIFVRHRNIFIVAFEGFNFAELTGESIVSHFRVKHADPNNHVLLMYTPVTNFTTAMMKSTMELLALDSYNRIDKKGLRPIGVIGTKSKVELVERALLHRKEQNGHGVPVGVSFEHDENDMHSVLKVPYDLTYTIYSFDESIHATADNYPFVEPPTSKLSLSAYVSSGFLGLQYAIDNAFIRMVMERQRRDAVKAETRNLDTSDDVDDLFDFLDDPDIELGPESVRAARSDPGSGGAPNANEPESKRRAAVTDPLELPEMKLKMFTFANWRNQRFRHLVSFSVSLGIVTAYSFMSFFIVRQIVQENTSGIKDLLQMHGLPHYIHWIILFFHALFFRSITSLFVVIGLETDYGYGPLVEAASTSLLFVFVLIHQLSLTFMNFFMATCIKSIHMCGVIAIFSGVVSFYAPETFAEMNLIGIYTNYGLAIIFPNWALRHVLQTIVDLESDKKGADWSNVWENNHVTNMVSVGTGMILLTGTGIVYFFMAAYHDMTGSSKLFPPSRKWYDFKELARQRRESKLHQEELHKDIAEGRATNFEKPAIYEEAEPDRKCFVHVRNLSKRYGKHKVALDSVNMNILHEEITVILGHTNSGKSTLMAILAGMMMPSSGYAIVKGYDVNFESSEARKYVGLCTQKLVAFNLLTVREHINLCYRLRGYSKKDCDRHCATLLQRMRLWTVRGLYPERLKTDEMRRLGISLALADAPKVLLLDEPTSQLDPTERREIWEIILSLRHHHTIILTTNYQQISINLLMDEAEFLADRVALLAHGRLICYGSIDFLKSNYDTGYFLKIEPISDVNRLDASGIMKIVHNHLGPDVPITTKRHTRIKDVDTLELELPANQRLKFADVCDELEEKKAALSISRYSIRQVSLNDIFIRICSSVAAQGAAADLYVRRDSVGEIRSALRCAYMKIPEPPEKSAMISGQRHQIYALLKKQWVVVKTSYHELLLYYFVPLLLIWIVVFQAKLFILPQQGNPSRALTMQAFETSGSHLVNDDLVIFHRTGQDSKVIAPYGVELPRKEQVITRIYEAIKMEPGLIGYNKEKHMAAFELRKMNADKRDKRFEFVGYFSSGALHSAPIVMNVMNNVYLRAAFPGDEDGRFMTLTTVNDPLPEVKPLPFEEDCGVTCTILALMMSFAIAFLSNSCIFLPMMERQNGVKHLQLMCGVHPVIYWVAIYIVDAAVMLVVVCIIVLIFAADYYRTFSSPELVVLCNYMCVWDAGAIWIICTLFLMWSGLMYGYFMSVAIPTKYNGYNFLAVFHLFLGILPTVILWEEKDYDDDETSAFFRNLFVVFVPPYTITSAFKNYFEVASKRGVSEYIKKVCDVSSVTGHEHFLHRGHYISERAEFAGVTQQDMQLAKCCARICLPVKSCYKAPAAFNASSETWMKTGGLLIMIERGVIQSWFQRIFSRFIEYKEQGYTIARKSRDVYQEKLAVVSKVKGGKKDVVSQEDVDLVCLDLTKSTSTRLLVRDFNLEVKTGQCIAILGGGGSGKTCIAKMIAGELMPTRGNCYIHNKNLFHNRKDYLSKIGYCPQKTACYTEFTGSQMCKLMGRLRGIPDALLDTHTVKWLSVFGLEEVAHDKCKHYAPGMRQRLGAAMALIGGPSIILLDEPTTNVDAFARERFWGVIEHLNRQGHTILLTTYSTDEAFALAEKVVVIAEGNMQCVGSPEYLQTKYGRGHTILIKLKHEIISSAELIAVTLPKVVEFKNKVLEAFAHIDLLDEHDDMIMYFLRDARFTWADVFRSVHALVDEYKTVVDGFEVAESEIEDIFIFMTNKYHELDKPRRSEPPTLMQEPKLKDMDVRGSGEQRQSLPVV